jgi:hypothetical protein
VSVKQPYRNAGLREDLRDAAPHDAAANDADSLKGWCTHAKDCNRLARYTLRRHAIQRAACSVLRR